MLTDAEMKYLNEMQLAGKRVLIRADLNVPIASDGSIADDHRIKASLPTINFVRDKGGRAIVMSHLGRPKGAPKDEFSLRPVAGKLSDLLGTKVALAKSCIGGEVEKLTKSLSDGEVLLLENVRFHREEEENDPGFAQELAKLGDVYVNDAFATAHRAHASTAGVANFFTERAGGFTVRDELENFRKAFSSPERPFAAIFGGAKISTKMQAIQNVGKKADIIVVGGAMANTFFAADGHEVGKSLYQADQVDNARRIREELENSECKLFIPSDVIVSKELKSGVPTRIAAVDDIAPDEMALDIGPESLRAFQQALGDAKTIIWNGPMGAFETPEFSSGTFGIVDTLAQSPAFTVVGGGDTDYALHQRGAFDKMSYVSTAGGAFLKLLEGSELPGIAALE